MGKITVQLKSVYGTEKFYPACPLARLFAEIAGTETLTPATLKRVRKLGYYIEVSGGQRAAAELALNKEASI